MVYSHCLSPGPAPGPEPGQELCGTFHATQGPGPESGPENNILCIGQLIYQLNANNFLNNNFIFNPIAPLELSQSALYIYALMSKGLKKYIAL